ncbi:MULTISPECIES: DUF3859 domain-containing protein [Vibrio]|uniref:DUF3859 domain-containing protein n=1 Tax=Vibrio bivalvicida TaxID=1276888 RepID=A0A177XVI2_9VIBR|nr:MULTISPECIES: DUF3859 domain-containing protein [Vibrio]KLN65795.1 hypothetical protein ZX61_07120 [Vibrio sp. VPAP30]OAJ92366.1 hypothetical protein APB76_20425 [Vibrio bivalvicida]
MAKRTPVVEMTSYGIYQEWDSKSKHLPKIQEFTTKVPADEEIEFGFIVNIKKAKGEVIDFCIAHPGIRGKKGQVLEPFTGDLHIGSNDWDFYLGDTIQLLDPIDGFESNIGKWRMTISLNGNIIAEKTFDVYARDEGEFWKQRGF